MKNNELKNDSILLMSGNRVRRSISRMAYQVAEDNQDKSSILVVGVKERGLAVAEMLVERLSSLSNEQVHLLALPRANGSGLAFNPSSLHEIKDDFNYIILVDDVIFSGGTMLEAVERTLNQFNPKVLRTIALVDRGHRAMPVEATFSGLELPTKLDEHVHVIINEGAGLKVVLIKSSE